MTEFNESYQVKRIGTMIRELFGQKLMIALCQYSESDVSREDLATKADIPISSAYRHMHELEIVGLVYQSGIIKGRSNNPIKLYRSKFKGFTIICEPSGIKLVIS